MRSISLEDLQRIKLVLPKPVNGFYESRSAAEMTDAEFSQWVQAMGDQDDVSMPWRPIHRAAYLSYLWRIGKIYFHVATDGPGSAGMALKTWEPAEASDLTSAAS